MEGLLGDTAEGTASLQPQETQGVQRGSMSLMLTTRPQAHLNLALPYSKHGLCLLPDAVQIHVGSCRKQE